MYCDTKEDALQNFNLGTVLNMGSYILAFSLGAGPVPALLLPEIFASRIRAKAVSLSMGVHWVSASVSDYQKF